MNRIQIGDIFERWTVTGRSGNRWLVQCSCGNSGAVRGSVLNASKSKSCGCLRREMGVARGKASRKHGMEGSSEYQAWAQMKHRCSNPNNRMFKHYGGRGITVCERWRNDFAAFYADMGNRPGPWASIDRIDNDGGYEPSNCRWVDAETQNNNTSRNRHLRCSKTGRVQTVAQWARELSVTRPTIYNWWVDEDTLVIPSKYTR